VLAARVAWSWVEGVMSKMQQALNQRRQLQVLLAARDGRLLYAPANWLGRRFAPDADLTEGGAWVVGTRTELRLADGLGLGWTAIVRQGADVALAPVRTTQRNVFVIVFVAGLLAAAAAALATRVLTRRLTRLAADAEAVRRGERQALAVPGGVDEVSRIGATLAQVVDHLQTEKHALQALNAELDQRVAERTLRIERMADEARHAAVTRERLRIARDLHDTLAHSLMALLTQIRLVRKLRERMTTGELEEELGRAETVAGTGLAEARAAIMQMRDNGVRDSGLGPALHDLLRRFGQRTGTTVTLDDDPEVAAWAEGWVDERSETVFRILEEALRNVERHAAAGAVRVTLRNLRADAPGGARRVRIEVADDGQGFDPAQPRPGHYGLRGMREQATLIDAELALRSAPGQGTRVVLDFGA
jgi:signal transduction histidine kinase